MLIPAPRNVPGLDVCLNMADSIKMALVSRRQDEDPLSYLGRPTIIRVKNVGRQHDRLVQSHITSLSDRIPNNRPSITMARTSEITDIFQDQELGLSCIHDLHDVEEKRSSRAIFKSELMAGFRKRLTRKTGAKNVVFTHTFLDRCHRTPAIRILNVLSRNSSNVINEMPGLISRREDGFVNHLALGIQFTCKNALSTEALKSVMKAADTRKKIDELELRHRGKFERAKW